MLTLRCTQKLLKKNPGPTNGRQDTLVSTLGGWHANLIRLASSPIVLCVNDVSLLSVLIPGRNSPNLVSAFRDRLSERLSRMGLAQDTILEERAAMEIVQVQPTNSKSVLGSMNDFVKHLKWKVATLGTRFNFQDADRLEDMLSEIPMGPLKYKYPAEVAAAAFSLEWKTSGLDRWVTTFIEEHGLIS
ncbi:MAG: hypothetical protein QOJ64_4271 [Acidobacteriota bacterium]|nr:hypothetical protein [Acidobacteriota bacterium]